MNGTTRHVVVDILGLLLVVMVNAASVHDRDRDRGRRLLDRLRFAMPSVAPVWADGGYAGRPVEWTWRVLRVMRCRRLVRDHERLPDSHETMVKWAMIGLMTRRLEPESRRRPWAPPRAA